MTSLNTEPVPPVQPPVPRPRKRTISATGREREKEKEKERAERERERAVRTTGFGFPFSSPGASKNQPTSPSPPPQASQPNQTPIPIKRESTGTESRRGSQIVHYSGFINRHSGASVIAIRGHALSTALAKNWKPYKAILKGSKLFLYKPPNDRTVPIKALFPQGLESVIDETPNRPETVIEEPEPPTARSLPEKEEPRRRMRLYQGRSRHPELVLGEDGSVIKGSVDALLHEAVFGTSFVTDDTWKGFAFSMMLCIPRLMDRVQFETRLIRYVRLLIEGASEEEQEGLRLRGFLLARQYISDYGAPIAQDVWDVFYSEAFSPEPTSDQESAQILTETAPSVNVSRSGQLDTATSSASPEGQVSRQNEGMASNLAAKLETEGLTSELQLRLESGMVARSLTVFQRALILNESSSIRAADIIGFGPYELDDTNDPVLDDTAYASLFGSDDSPHWLTRYIVADVLNVGGGGGPSVSHSDFIQASKTHMRSSLINHWIKVGEYCHLTGDRCSWKAIESALCSRPVARLDTVWKRVDNRGVGLVQGWLKDDNGGASQKRVLAPWGGDVRERVAELWRIVRVESTSKEDQWDAKILAEIAHLVRPIVSEFSQAKSGEPLTDDNAIVSGLVQFWRSVHGRPLPRSHGLQAFLSQSFAAEPRQKGRFEPYHWRRPVNNSFAHTLVPLLFVEPLPTVSFIDRDSLIRSRKESWDSLPHPGLDEAQIAQLGHIRTTLDSGRQRTIKLVPSGEMGGLILKMYDGELILSVPDILLERISRPPSSVETGLDRQPSQIRVNHPGLDRKSSIVRRNSLPALSQPTHLMIPEAPPENTLRVVVKGGTLDRLVDILISGLDGVSVAVADDNGEMPLRDGRRTRALRLDHNEFKSIWWSVFRSFVTPLVFFELLRKRFLNLGTTPASTTKARIHVLAVVSEWLEKGTGAQDILADSELYNSMRDFLDISARIPSNLGSEERIAWMEVENARQNTFSLFMTQTRRPKLQYPLSVLSADSSTAQNYGTYLSAIDDLDPEALVDNLDALAAATMRAVTADDVFAAVDLLEVQSADRTGWFLSHEPVTTSDDIEIQTIYYHFQQIEPSPLISELAQESIYRFLPANIRGLVRAHAVVRKFLMTQILAPRLGLRQRQARMELLLRAIEVCRLRMGGQTPRDIASSRSVRSFVETAIISAIVSPESRLFTVAWLSVATARGVSMESVASLISRPVVRSTANHGYLTVDIGWLFERALEIGSLPNVVESNREASNLINMEKRRHLFNLIITSLTIQPSRSRRLRVELDRIDIERLNNMHREVAGHPFDLRLLKEEAYQESLHPPFPLPHSKKALRPFARIIQAQQEKCKRDRQLRERLLREKGAEQQRAERMEEDIDRAMHTRPQNPRAVKQQRSRRTMSSAFFNLMRPLSSAFTSDTIYASPVKRSPEELDFQPNGKPSLVINIVGATVMPFINSVRLFLFTLTTEDGGRYLLQASTNSGLEGWISAISQTAKLSTARRLTYIGNTPKPQFADHIQVVSQTTRRHPTAVFGVELDFLLEREAGGNEVPIGAVPRILDMCLNEIEAHGLQEVGLYRIPGATSAINTIREQFDNGEEVTYFSQDYLDIFAVCDTVKTWLRSLPEPIFPEKSYYEAIHIMQMPDFEERLVAVRNVVHNLPTTHFYLLRRICEHLERITDYEEQNHMTAQALAVLFNPTLLRSPSNNFGELMHNMTHTSQLLQSLIIHFHRIFDETDVEQDDEIEEADVTEHTGDERPTDSRLSSVPTDVIHDHDPDLELPPSLQNSEPETL
ncbi:hypothetical protein M422DRAFT_158043 [Sphaerobolus stellatus SS14]|nr:hypothetical protein M422DRAFT_158043 [Sphaerobolus stellatus SS14]